MNEMMSFNNWEQFMEMPKITSGDIAFMAAGMLIWLAIVVAIDIFASRLMTNVAVNKGYSENKKNIFAVIAFGMIACLLYGLGAMINSD